MAAPAGLCYIKRGARAARGGIVAAHAVIDNEEETGCMILVGIEAQTGHRNATAGQILSPVRLLEEVIRFG